MKYFLIDIETLKVYPCTSNEDIIRQVKIEETWIPKRTEVHLENIIFNPKLFNTQEKLGKLKQTLGGFICDNPTKDEKKVDARTKNQFFYLYAALWSLPDVIADDSMANFVRQLAIWFPEWLPSEKKKQRSYEQSLSHEKKKWEKQERLLKVTEWKSFIKQSGMSISKATYFEALAMKVYTSLNLMIKDVRNENIRQGL